MIVTVLSENTSSCGLPAEHGLSLYIETENRRILFDTGQSGLFAENAGKLGVDLSAVDLAVISHGHYDHGGGIKAFTQINKTAPVYLSEYAFEAHFNAEGREIGLDPASYEGGRTVLVRGSVKLADGITLYGAGEIPQLVDFGSSGLGILRDGEIVPDDFRHEQYLLIEENGKRILFGGCAHKGIINIVERFMPDFVFGGFHFVKMPLDDTLRGYAQRLSSYPVRYYTCHCTGAAQYEFIKPYIADMSYISAGDRVEIK